MTRHLLPIKPGTAEGGSPGRLDVESVDAVFSGVAALQDVTLHLEQGEILGLIGPNGAGKTTLINVLSGFVRPSAGEVMLDGRRLTRLPAHARTLAGLARTFQGVRLFGRLTVAENVEAAALAVGLHGRAASERVRGALRRLQVDEHADVPASSLSYGLERRVAIARAIATNPAFLLLDEPAAGLDDVETAQLADIVRSIRYELGPGVLVVEHDMSLIMGLCDRVHVLVEGRTAAVGKPAEIRQHPEVRRAYLGSEEDHVIAGH
jgi:branched-chain amino acid transport system ATP-binding protein